MADGSGWAAVAQRLATADDGVEEAARRRLEHARGAARLALNPAPVRGRPRGSQYTKPDIEQQSLLLAQERLGQRGEPAGIVADPASLPDLSVVPGQISRPGLLGLLPLLGGAQFFSGPGQDFD